MWKVLEHIGMVVIILASAGNILYGIGEPTSEWFTLIGGVAIEATLIVVAIKKRR